MIGLPLKLCFMISLSYCEEQVGASYNLRWSNLSVSLNHFIFLEFPVRIKITVGIGQFKKLVTTFIFVHIQGNYANFGISSAFS